MLTEKRLIDQDKVYQLACAGCIRHGEKPGECYHDEPCERLIFALTTAEPLDAVEVVHGRWKVDRCEVVDPFDGNSTFNTDVGECSVCGHRYEMLPDMYYCPNCGAKMDGE